MISIQAFDSLLGYDFFIAINNKDLRRIELDPYASYYMETVRLAKKWRKYRIKHKLPIPLEQEN